MPDDLDNSPPSFSAARKFGGTGLGLAIVDRIAKMHGGNVRLLPREDGLKGLRARVELPVPLKNIV